MPLLSAHHLSNYFGERLLFSDISFDVEEKSRIGFVGANGCGKTTLFHILTGDIAPDEGQVVKLKNNSILGIPGEIQIGNFRISDSNQIINLRGNITNKGTNI